MTYATDQGVLNAHLNTEAERQITAYAQRAPSVLFRPALTVDGNQFCALYGENLQDGIAGFGDTPADAMADFDKNWLNFSMIRKVDIECDLCHHTEVIDLNPGESADDGIEISLEDRSIELAERRLERLKEKRASRCDCDHERCPEDERENPECVKCGLHFDNSCPEGNGS